MDSEDEAFVNRLKKKMEVGALQFEQMIDRLEKGSGQQVLLFWGGFFLFVCFLFSMVIDQYCCDQDHCLFHCILFS